MKTLENKKTELKDGENNMGYVDLALICLNQVPQNGFSPKEMAGVVKVINTIEDVKMGAKIKLEDADFDILKEKVNSTRWRMVHKEIVNFTDYINSIE